MEMTTNGEEKRRQIYRKCFICGLEGKRKKKKKTEKEKEENRERRALNSAWKYTTLQGGLFLMVLCCVGSKEKKSISVNMQVKCSPGMSAVCGTKSGIQRMSTSLRALYPVSCLVPGILSVSNFYFPLKKYHQSWR